MGAKPQPCDKVHSPGIEEIEGVEDEACEDDDLFSHEWFIDDKSQSELHMRAIYAQEQRYVPVVFAILTVSTVAVLSGFLALSTMAYELFGQGGTPAFSDGVAGEQAVVLAIQEMKGRRSKERKVSPAPIVMVEPADPKPVPEPEPVRELEDPVVCDWYSPSGAAEPTLISSHDILQGGADMTLRFLVNCQGDVFIANTSVQQEDGSWLHKGLEPFKKGDPDREIPAQVTTTAFTFAGSASK